MPGLRLHLAQDLADPVRTEGWLDHHNRQPGTRALALDASETAPTRRLLAACRELAPTRQGLARPMRVLPVADNKATRGSAAKAAPSSAEPCNSRHRSWVKGACPSPGG